MKWIILQAFRRDDGSIAEWEAAGTTMGATRDDAIRAASVWKDLRRPIHVKAIEWSAANGQLRQDAQAENRHRQQIRALTQPPIHAVLMLGATTALVADYPQLERSLTTHLGRALEGSVGSQVFLVYLTVLFDSFCRVAQQELDTQGATRLERVLRSEFAVLLSAPMESGSVPPDELGQLMDPIRECVRDHDPATAGYAQAAGSLIAAVVGMPDDPHVIGQSAVQIQSSIARLRIHQVISTGRASELYDAEGGA